ncbi:MAG: ParB/RepB/Spo0J family partition protein [Bacillota bacterium]
MAKRKSIADSVIFKNVDSFFDVTDPTNADEKTICDIPISDLYPFQNHPFQVRDDDEKMLETMESIEKQGVIYPIIVRPREGQDGFEIVAGHRRTRACELLGLATVPAIIKKLDDEESTIVMVDSNIQREELLCSEKAFAYKMKLEAIKRTAGRPKNNCAQVGHNFNGKKSVELLADESSDSRNQIKRYIRLTHLIKELLDMADKKSLPFTTAVSLSYLTEKEQGLLLTKMKEVRKPSQVEAKKLKEESMATNGGLTNAFIEKLLLPDFSKMQAVEEGQAHKREMATNPLKGMLVKNNVLQKYFRDDVAEEEIEKILLRLLEQWHQAEE